ncbi:SVM family protein [Polynucleobacter sp. IMCC 30228]
MQMQWSLLHLLFIFLGLFFLTNASFTAIH